MRLTYGSLDLTDYPYSIMFGSDFGAPQNVTEAYAFLLQDGEIELTDRTSNRTLQFSVLIEGSDLLECAEAESALIAEANKALNTITLDPEDFGPATVYETFRAQVAHARDDDGEMARLRIYTVTVKASPAGRSVNEVVTPALAASGTTTTLVNDGSATTNWTGAVDGASTSPSVVSGAVGITTAAVLGGVTISLTYTAAITTSSTKYLVVDWKPATAGQSPTLRAYADGTELVQMARAQSPTAGYTRSWFGPVAASSVAVLRLDGYSVPAIHGSISSAEARSLFIDNISRTDVTPTLGSARQLLRSLDIGGSAPTPGALAVEHASSALGDVLVYTFPDVDDAGASTGGYVPALRPYRVAGGATTTTDATMVSGARDNILGATATFDVPLSRILRGGHLLSVRSGFAAASGPQPVTFNWTMQVRVNSAGVGPTVTGTSVASLTSTSGNIVTLGKASLPTLDVDPASSAVLRLTIAATAPGAVTAVPLDEVWLFNTDLGNLLGPVACGTAAPSSGGAANRLFVEPPSVAVPRQTVRIGFALDRSDSFYPSGALGGWQFLQVGPPRTNVFTVTTNALDASVTFRCFRRWHTYAAS